MRSSSDMAASNTPEAAGADAVRSPDAARPLRLRLLFLVPAGVFAGLMVAFGIGLDRDPRVVPAPLIGRPVPEFRLAPVQGRDLGLSTAALRGGEDIGNV